MSRRHDAFARFETTATQRRDYRVTLAGTRVLSCEFPPKVDQKSQNVTVT